MAEARARQAQLTKPAGALGVLEDASVTLCGIQRTCPPPAARAARRRRVRRGPRRARPRRDPVAAGGHRRDGRELPRRRGRGQRAGAAGRRRGVRRRHRRRGRRRAGRPRPGRARSAAGTSDLAAGPAMSRDEAAAAIMLGADVAHQLVDAGHDCLLTGDMGIANTTASAALVAAFTGAEPADVTGRGTGIDDAMHAHKIAIVQVALERRAVSDDPVETLASLGGLEHAGLAGFVLAGAAARRPGGPRRGDRRLRRPRRTGARAGGARLLLRRAPQRRARARASRLQHLGLRPLVDLDLRLGEGTGAALAFPIVEAAGATLREMATFDSAGVATEMTRLPAVPLRPAAGRPPGRRGRRRARGAAPGAGADRGRRRRRRRLPRGDPGDRGARGRRRDHLAPTRLRGRGPRRGLVRHRRDRRPGGQRSGQRRRRGAPDLLRAQRRRTRGDGLDPGGRPARGRHGGGARQPGAATSAAVRDEIVAALRDGAIAAPHDPTRAGRRPGRRRSRRPRAGHRRRPPRARARPTSWSPTGSRRASCSTSCRPTSS